MNPSKKIGRNDNCSCGSDKKFKFCCIKIKVPDNPNSSELILKCMDYFKKEYTNYNIIDISHKLESKNYRNYQLNNIKTKNIMIAEKNELNNDIFTERGSLDGDIIIMYHGAYVCFEKEEFDNAKITIKKMIRGDLDENCNICFKRSTKNCCCSICGNNCCFECTQKLHEEFGSEISNGNIFIKCPFCRTKEGIKLSAYSIE